MTAIVQPSAGQAMFLAPGAAHAAVPAIPPWPMAVPGSAIPYHLYNPQTAGGIGVNTVSDYILHDDVSKLIILNLPIYCNVIIDHAL